MGAFTVGEVVLVAFPYADFSRFKKRPALVIALAELDNLILCQITSQQYTSKRAIALRDNDFTQGSLKTVSFIRPDKIFTVEKNVVKTSIGKLRKEKTLQVKTVVRKLFA